MSKRENFPKKVIDTLRGRVNNRCSNPDCRVPTTGPTKAPDKMNNIGIAAHITAASPGGPRYDSSMIPKKRKSINNAIWLCSNCSIKIDKDVRKYSVKVLRDWKNSAENKAREELGKKIPDENYVIESITTALTGLSPKFMPDILSNASKATSRSLEMLDPRFSINANHINGMTSFEFKAKEPVEANILVKSNFANEFLQKYNDLIENGETLIIDSRAVEFKGSPIFEEIFIQNGRLEISNSLNKTAIQKIWLTHPTAQETLHFYDIPGNIAVGESTITFEGFGCDRIISIKYRVNRQQNINASNFDITFIIDFKEWDNKAILSLPFFDSLYELIKRINEGWIFHTSMEIGGKRIFHGTATSLENNEYFKLVNSQLHYIEVICEICNKLNKTIIYNHSYEYSSEEHLRATELNEILSNRIILDKNSMKNNAKCSLIVADDLSNITVIVEKNGTPVSFYYEETEQETIKPFSQTLRLPRFKYFFSEFIPHIKSDISNLKPGDLIEVEWEPTENCIFTVEAIWDNP